MGGAFAPLETSQRLEDATASAARINAIESSIAAMDARIRVAGHPFVTAPAAALAIRPRDFYQDDITVGHLARATTTEQLVSMLGSSLPPTVGVRNEIDSDLGALDWSTPGLNSTACAVLGVLESIAQQVGFGRITIDSNGYSGSSHRSYSHESDILALSMELTSSRRALVPS